MDKLHEQFVRSYVKIINYKVSMQMYGIFVRSVCTMEFKDIKYRYCHSCCIESEQIFLDKLYGENKKALNFNCDSIRKKRIILEIYKKRKFNYLFVQPIRQLVRS